MKEKNKKQKTAIMIILIVLSVIMGVVASIIISKNPRSNTPALPIFMVSNIFETVAGAIVISQIIPFDKISQWVESKINASAPEFKFILVNSIFVTVIGVIIIEFIACLINIIMARANIPADQAPPLIMMFISTYLPLLIPSILICYVISLPVSVAVYKILGVTPAENKE